MQAIATMNQDKANVAKFEADLALARTTLQRYVVGGTGHGVEAADRRARPPP